MPSDWHYIEVAAEHGLELDGLELEWLRRGEAIRLPDGRRLKIRGDRVGIAGPSRHF